MNGKSMKKGKSAVRDSARKEYARSDLGEGVRGKHLAALDDSKAKSAQLTKSPARRAKARG